MNPPIQHPNEPTSNTARALVARYEPRTLRTYTPTQAVIARSAGVFHWTPEGRRLYDFTSGVLVANLGHNSPSWMQRFFSYMGWSERQNGPGESSPLPFTAADAGAVPLPFTASNAGAMPLPFTAANAGAVPLPFTASNAGAMPLPFTAANASSPPLPFTAYNAVTLVETEATRRLVELLQGRPGGRRLEQVLWAASGSEAIQKALWAALARDRSRDIILATRYGFHGKKGLANAVTGCETDRDRDPRVRFISFPRDECADVAQRGQPFDPTPYRKELAALHGEFGRRLAVLITEPYLGGGGSYHPPKEYLQMLQSFCREHDLVFILDEVQSNFGRTGALFAFETYGLEPDVVVLGKGLGNGVPVAAAGGAAKLFAPLDYGEGSDTWSANPLACAAVLATLDEFAARDVLANCRQSSARIEAGLIRLRELPFVAHVRGEAGGMVWGVEMRAHAGRSAPDWANAVVLACYLGDARTNPEEGIHLLGPLSKKVVRIAPPLTITPAESQEAMVLMHRLLSSVSS